MISVTAQILLLILVAIIVILALEKIISIVSFMKAVFRRRGSKMVKLAKSSSLRFRFNLQGDIVAVCTEKAFEEALVEHANKVEQGEVKQWSRVICFAKPTFTFAGNEEIRRPIHTGDRNDLDTIVMNIVERVTGIKKKDVDPRDYDSAFRSIFIRDRRLFVPYNNINVKTMEEQFAFYGKTTIDQARQHLKP